MQGGLPVSFKDNKGVTQPQGALVALDPEQGTILAMIGGRDFTESPPLNRALAPPRQPGSLLSRLCTWQRWKRLYRCQYYCL